MNIVALLPNLAGGDGLIIFIIILLLFGAKKLPELARGLGSAVREFSKAKDEIEHEITRPSTTPQIEPPKNIQPQIAKTEDPYHQDPYHQEIQGEPHHAPAETAPETSTTAPTPPAGTTGAGPTIPV
jgi:sec-independent protein translocase protein TatA